LSSHEAARRKANPREFVKRALDVAISVLAIVVLTPVFMVVWIAIHLDSPGPAVFRQRRIGRDEKPFTCFKFRTLRHNADENVHREAIRRVWANEPLSDDPDAPYKLTDDSRVTRVGRWLRRSSLDELPQLFNVLRGEMSIVGPRPAIPYELEHFSRLIGSLLIAIILVAEVGRANNIADLERTLEVCSDMHELMLGVTLNKADMTF
jgi:lipopolysaccharide/colanic/teichoic acid biosynthesis glycosyltransferase